MTNSKFQGSKRLEFGQLFLYRRFFGHDFTLVVQFTLTYVSAMTYMDLPGSAVCGQGGGSSFIMGSALCSSLLAVSPFRIWHILIIIVRKFFLVVCEW
jgi:hypothetical protein